MQYKIIIAIIGLIVPWLPAPASASALSTTGEMPFYIAPVKMVEPLKDINPAPVVKLELAGFHFDPMGSHPNSYAPSNCTWGASSMEPDIPQNWGNANTWDDNARAAGITVSDTPIVGAIAQTDRGYYGHVAVVTAIDPSGQAVITEMNWDSNGGIRTRLAAPSEFVYIYV